MSLCQQLIFAAPRQVVVEEQESPIPAARDLLVKSELSAISAGSEMLAYRGEVAPDTVRDEVLEGHGGTFRYPFPYGYATVGKVVAHGETVDPQWLGRRVVGLVPHASHFVAATTTIIPAPVEMPAARAVFLPNAETAVSLVQDGQPILGERIVVVGQGVVGLLVAGLLVGFRLSQLTVLDRQRSRRAMSQQLGDHRVLDPTLGPEGICRAVGGDGADLVFELSGDPQALDLAIALCGHEGRVVVGSWYGQRRAEIDLGTRFFRRRLRLQSSQVSHIAPRLRGRWDRQRRLSLAVEAVNQLAPENWITHRVPLSEAAQAYRMLDEKPEDCLQVILTHAEW